MADTKQVVTLLAEKGRKWEETQQCIGSYDGSIVFLPRDARAGDVVRVALTPVSEKRDARGRMMYSAQCAPVILSGNVRHLIAREAEMLRGCRAFDQPAALALLRAQYEVELDAWKGYSHYYFQESGWVFGSHFPPATLYLYEQFGGMAPHAMTEPLLWVADKKFFALRERGEELTFRSEIPQLTNEAIASLVRKTEAGETVLSSVLVKASDGRVEIPGHAEALWRKARRVGLPSFAVPDLETDASLAIPHIICHEYGRDLDGHVLKSYAVLTAQGHGAAAWEWFTSFADATIAHDYSVEVLGKLRVVWASKAQLMPQLLALNVRRRNTGLPEVEFRSTKFRAGWEYEYSPENIRMVEDETSAKEEEIAQAARAEAEAARTAEAATRAEAQAAKDEAAGATILRDFRVFIHESGTSGDGGGYVIRPDGSLRAHDRDWYERSHRRGRHEVVWDLVAADEVALEWRGWRKRAENSFGTKVRKEPQGYTLAQRETMSRLAEEHGIESWENPIYLFPGQDPQPRGETPATFESLGDALQRLAQTPEGQEDLRAKLAQLRELGIGGKRES